MAPGSQTPGCKSCIVPDQITHQQKQQHPVRRARSLQSMLLRCNNLRLMPLASSTTQASGHICGCISNWKLPSSGALPVAQKLEAPSLESGNPSDAMRLIQSMLLRVAYDQELSVWGSPVDTRPFDSCFADLLVFCYISLHPTTCMSAPCNMHDHRLSQGAPEVCDTSFDRHTISAGI